MSNRISRDVCRVVRTDIAVKTWISDRPPIERLRPGVCPACNAPSRPLGATLGLHGHGTRPRQLRGPPTHDARPAIVVVDVQRFRCRHCHVVITVVPDDVVPRRHYRASAIALALLLFGVLTRPIREVRARVCPWRIVEHAAARRWLTLLSRLPWSSRCEARRDGGCPSLLWTKPTLASTCSWTT